MGRAELSSPPALGRRARMLRACARNLRRTAIATLLCLPVGVLVQRNLGFDIVSLDASSGAWLVLLWPAVLLGLGLAAVALVAFPVGLLWSRAGAGGWSLAARVVVETAAGTALFRAVSFPISPGDTALLLLPQLVFFAAYHIQGRTGAAVRRAGLRGRAQPP